MRKFINLVAFAVLLTAPAVAWAQSTLTIANGTETNSYVPFYGYMMDANQHNQILYPADSLTALVGKEITSITFHMTGTPTWNSATTVSVGTTTDATLSGLNTTASLDQVWQGSISCSNDQWAITFTDAFLYTGGNLLVDLDATAGQWSSASCYGVTLSGAAYCYNGQRNFLPKTTFGYQNASTCPKPATISVSNITSTTADLTWTAGGSETSWNIYLDTELVANVSSMAYTLTGLDALTSYTVSVTAQCSEESSPRTTSFTTACGGSTCEITVSTSASYNYAYYLPKLTVYQNGVELGMVQGTTQSISVCSTDPVAIIYTAPSYSYGPVASVLDGGGTELFNGSTSGYSSGDTLLNITAACPTCIPPTALTIDTVGENEITITWTPRSDATQFAVYQNGVMISDNVYDSMYTFSGLSANTAYTFGIQAICTSNDSSNTASIATRTACGATTLPFSVDFEDVAYNGAWYPCWDSIIHAGTDPSVNDVRNHTSGGTYGMYLQAKSPENYNLVVGPVMDVDGDNIYCRFWAYRQNGWIKAGVISNPRDTSTFIPLVTIDNATGWNEYEFNTAALDPTANYRIAWMAYHSSPSTYGTQIGEIDDIYVSEIPSCIRVTAITLDSAATNELYLVWSDAANSGATYTVSYWANGDSDTLSATTSDTTITLTGLDANTVYNMFVTANCAAGDAEASPIFTFRTACGAMTLPFSVDFEDAAYNGAWYPCWDSTIHAGTDPSVNDQPGGSYNPTQHTPGGTYAMYLQGNSSENYNLVVGPEMDAVGNAINVRFWAYLNNSSRWIKAGVITNPRDTSTFIPMVTITGIGTGWNEYEFNTSTLDATANYRVAWLAYGNGYIGKFDDVTISEYTGCERPASASIGTIGARQAEVSWATVDGATDYTVYYNTSNDPYSSDVQSLAVTGDSSVIVSGLQPETHYYVWVATDCGGAESDLRTAGDFTTLVSCPGVSNLTVDSVSSDGAVISWTAGDVETEWYVILDSTEIGIINDTTYEVTGLDAMTGHTFYVRAVCGSDDTSSTDSINFATSCDAAVCNLTAYVTDSYNDSWNGNLINIVQAGITVGTIECPSSQSGSTFTYEVCSSAPVSLVYVAGQWASEMGGYIQSGNGETIFTISNMGSHSNGDVLATMTTPCPECVPPTNLAVADGSITTDGATIAWTAQDGQTAWLVMLDSGTAVSVTDTFYIINGLDARSTHTAYVATDCGTDTSNWISVAFTTDCANGSCNVTIDMVDSYGDGWNNNAIEVYQNNSLAGSATIASGNSATALVNVCSGMPTEFRFFKGNYPSEISFTIYDGSGTEIYSAAQGDMTNVATGTVLDSTENACPSCIAPDSLVATLIDSNELAFAWRVIDSVYGYLVSFDGGSWEPAIGTYNAYSLTPNTAYTISLRAVCQPGDTSNASTITVRTACGQMVLPLVESFEGDNIGNVPSCWTVVNNGNGYPAISSTAHTGNNALTMNANSMIASSAIPLNGDSIYVSFWADVDASLEAGVMTNLADDSTFIPLITATAGDWTRYEFNTASLATYYDSTFHLAFRFNGGSTYSYANIDDINIRLNEGCMYPANVSATPGAHDISLEWSDIASTMNYVVSCRTTGSAAWDSAVYVNDTTYIISGLNAATSYDVRVGFICNSDTLWTDVSAITNCDVMPLPYSEDFDAYANDVMPPCWGWSSVSATHWDGGVFFRSYHGGGNEYVVVPQLDGNITKLQIEFDCKVGTIAENDGILFGVADAAGTLIAWIDTITDPNHSRNAHVHHILNMLNYTVPTGAARIAFAQLRNWNEWALIDNINITQLPDCYPVDSLQAYNLIDPDHTSFTWASLGEETQWQVYVDTVTVAIDSIADSLLTTVSTRSYEIPMGTIQGGGIYTFYVRSDCGVDQSNWTSYTFGAGTYVMNNSATADTVVACGLVVYDNGGPIAGYLPNSNSALVIRSENTGSELEVFGGAFGFGASGATLTIYDGEGTTGSVLFTYNVTDGRDTLTDTTLAVSTTGALTITFTANGTMCHTGYELYVHCVGAALCERPTQLNAMMTEVGEAMVTWHGTSAAYDLYYKPTGANAWSIASTTADSMLLTSLIPDTTYDMQVVGICGADTSTASFPIVLNTHYDVVITPCDPVSGLTVSNITNTTAQLGWTSAGSAWEIEVVRVGLTDTVVATTNPYTLTGLLPNMQYTVRVRTACSGVHVDPYSDWSVATTFTTTLDGPQSYTLTVVANNDAWGTVGGSGTYVEGTTATITANANDGYYFDRWNDGDTNATRTVTVTGDATYIANFAENGTQNVYYTISVSANNADWGTVTGAGQYAEGTTATITATANSGYHFVEWNDGVVDAVRTFTVTSDMSFVATFAANNGIDDVAAHTMNIYPNPASTTVTVSIEGIEGQAMVEIVDINGRVHGKWTVADGQLTIDVSTLAQGAYFVRLTDEKSTTASRLIVR